MSSAAGSSLLLRSPSSAANSLFYFRIVCASVTLFGTISSLITDFEGSTRELTGISWAVMSLYYVGIALESIWERRRARIAAAAINSTQLSQLPQLSLISQPQATQLAQGQSQQVRSHVDHPSLPQLSGQPDQLSNEEAIERRSSTDDNNQIGLPKRWLVKLTRVWETLHGLTLAIQMTVCLMFWAIAWEILAPLELPYSSYWWAQAGMVIPHGLGVVALSIDLFLSRVKAPLLKTWSVLLIYMFTYLFWGWFLKAYVYGFYPYDNYSPAPNYTCTLFCSLDLNYQNLGWMSVLVIFIVFIATFLLVLSIVGMQWLRDKYLRPIIAVTDDGEGKRVEVVVEGSSHSPEMGDTHADLEAGVNINPDSA